MVILIAQAGINKSFKGAVLHIIKWEEKTGTAGIKKKILSLLRAYPLNFHLI